MSRRIVLEIIISFVQIIIACTVFIIGWEFESLIHEPTTPLLAQGVGFHYYLQFSIIFFGFMILVANILDAIINDNKWKWAITITLTILAIGYWGKHFKYIPYKTLLYIITILVTIASKFLMERLIIKKGENSTNAKHAE